MSKVLFNGTLMYDNEGNFSFAAATFSDRAKDFIQMGRGTGLITRELATEGAIHRLTLRYKAIVDEGAIRQRLRNAFESGEGTLEVRGYEPINNCEMMTPPPCGDGSTADSLDGSRKGLGFTVTIDFMQLE